MAAPGPQSEQQQQLPVHQPSPRLVPLPPSLVPSPNLSTNSSSLALPPPSPALSDSGFSAFETSPMSMQDATFNFAQHFNTLHQFDDPPEEPTPTLAQESEAPLDPPPTLLGEHLPPSPTSFVPSLNSLASTDLSDYSPSPSIASVRMAQLVTRLPPHRMVNDDPSRLSVATSQSTRSSLRMSVTETDGEEEGTVWDAKRLSRPVKSATRSASAPLEQLTAAVEKEEQVCKDAVDPAMLHTALEVEGAKSQGMIKSNSEGSVSSWKDNLDAAVREMSAGDVDPAIRPEADAMTRMKSLLGPKMKIISKAPWDSDGSDGTLSPDAPPTPPKPPRARSSMDALRSVATSSATSRAAKLPAKENEKPTKSSARSKSFSILNPRKTAPSEADIKASEEAFRGLGLGVTGVNLARFESSSSLSSKAPPIGQSFLDLEDDKAKSAPKKKQSAPANPSAVTFPPPPSSPPSPPKSRKSFSSSSRVRPPPITFEMITPSSSMLPLASPNATSIPRSAPPHMASFVTVPRSDSNASLGVRAPKTSASGSSLATSANSGSSSPSTPTGTTTAFPPSPTSPTGSYFGSRSGAVSPTGPGYKLISLEEARERESQRIAAALAKKEKAMTPVEHIAGREDVMYGGASRDGSREPTTESVARTRATSGPASSAASTAPSHGSSPSTSTLAQAPIKTLKAKKSGFLRRMMGADKPAPVEQQQQPSLPSPPLSDLTRCDSATPSTQLATSPSYSVTISSPHASVDLRHANVDQGGLTPSPSVSSTSAAPASRVSFLPTPTPDPELRLRKGLAPSLSLRPVSMAFSAGLPSDFLANVASESTLSSSASTPTASTKVGGWISPPSTSPITAAHRPTSPTESLVAGSGPSSAQSPFAPSFNSSTTGGHSSLFERDEDLATTPVTPAFPSSPSNPTSPVLPSASAAGGSYAALQEEYARARKAWKSQQWELETQIRVLQAELEQVKAAQVTEGVECHECGAAYKTTPSPSIVQRPRFKGHGGSGALYGSGLAV
ncbi:hypothetical protein BCR35DRAFT_298359 [Leucosporidium creatinivorum]|uniref:Proteophosphoglycan ppg4 n=1 Tax=Leucosporidium creatinivorum TaxID=106004 RepID=A0A1Y2G6X4_9BASI|nr:hypothetical protein BCR35DRAFT_298359 [Leucosporidium creatinivorum]